MTPSSYRPESDGRPPTAPPQPTLRERVARGKVLARRAIGFWRVALLLFVVGTGLAIVVALNVKRSYQSTCIVLFKVGMHPEDHDETPAERAQKMAPKLKELLTTRSHLERVIREFRLYPKTVESKGMLEAIDEMRTHVGFRGKESDTFEISFDNESADVAQAVTQRLAETMMGEFTSANTAKAKLQVDFLTDAEKRAEDELEAANRSLATFLASHPEFTAEAKEANLANPIPTMPGLTASAAGGDAELGALRRERARIEAAMKAAPAAATPSVATSAPGSDGPGHGTQELVRARDEAAKTAAAAQAELAARRMRLTEEHPDVVSAKVAAEASARQLHIAEARLAAAEAESAPSGSGSSEPAGTSSDMPKKLAILDAQIAARQQQVARHPARASTSPSEPVNALVGLETDWQRLLRATGEAKAHEEDLRQHTQRAVLQASALAAKSGDQMEIIDPAFRPQKPSKGGRTNAALAGIALATILSLLYAVGRVLYSDALIDAADVEALGVVPVLGVLPKLSARRAMRGRGGAHHAL